MNADNSKKSSRIKRGKGLRVRLYPTPRQQRLILPMMHARHVIRNWICDIFNRNAARAAGDEIGANGLAIDCTESAVGAAVRDLRRLPEYKWLQTIPLWSALQVVKDCFKAREQALPKAATTQKLNNVSVRVTPERAAKKHLYWDFLVRNEMRGAKQDGAQKDLRG